MTLDTDILEMMQGKYFAMIALNEYESAQETDYSFHIYEIDTNSRTLKEMWATLVEEGESIHIPKNKPVNTIYSLSGLESELEKIGIKDIQYDEDNPNADENGNVCSYDRRSLSHAVIDYPEHEDIIRQLERQSINIKVLADEFYRQL